MIEESALSLSLDDLPKYDCSLPPSYWIKTSHGENSNEDQVHCFPIGSIVERRYPGNSPPHGKWLRAHGQRLTIADHPELFAACKGLCRADEEAGWFELPDFRVRYMGVVKLPDERILWSDTVIKQEDLPRPS